MSDPTPHNSIRVQIDPPARHGTGSELPTSIIRETRRMLRLPDRGPVVACGHAPVHWHPGILAKFMALRAISGEQSATPVVVTIDTVLSDPGRVEVPFVDEDGLPCSSEIRLFESSTQLTLGMQPAVTPPEFVFPFEMDAGQPAALRRMVAAVQTAHGEVSLAAQLMRSQLELSRQWVGRPSTLPASRLLKTACGRWLLEQMERDTRRCVQAYNAAVAVDPDAGLAPLDESLGELPLWDIRGDGRRTVRRQDLDSANLLPKALVTTAILRLAGCDLFIHGTGGARYDAVMEGWIRQWLGMEVAPFVVATADVRLPLPSPVEIARLGQDLVACGRRAFHDPESAEETDGGMLGESPGPRKREALESIESAPRGSAARRAAFESMHETLAVLREQPVDPSVAVADRVRMARRTVSRRDWEFIFYEADVLDGLMDEVERQVHEHCER
jgi:hypothetical protein